MAATLTQVLPLLKEHYHKNITEIFFTADKSISPILAAMEAKSMNDGLGRNYIVPIEFGLGGSASATFSVAQSKAQGSTTGSAALRDRWVVDAETVDAVAVWTRDAMLAAMGKGAQEIFDVMDREMKTKIMLIRKRLCQAAVEQGFGRVGTISAVTAAPDTITISPSEVNRVDVGDNLVAAEFHTTGVLRSATALIVTGWNPDTGLINLSASPVALGWAVNDTVFFEGDRENAASPNKLMPTGLGGWIPAVAPTSATFFGVNRLNTPQLGGHRIAAGTLDHAAALIRMANRLYKYGSKPDLCYVSAEDFAVLQADKDATKIVEIGGTKIGKYDIGFDSIGLMTHSGTVPVVVDAMMPQGNAWMGMFKDQRYCPFLAHNDDLVNIDNIDGNEIRALAGSTSLEMRLYFRGAMIVPAPGRFGIVTGLPAA